MGRGFFWKVNNIVQETNKSGETVLANFSTLAKYSDRNDRDDKCK